MSTVQENFNVCHVLKDFKYLLQTNTVGSMAFRTIIVTPDEIDISGLVACWRPDIPRLQGFLWHMLTEHPLIN
jgi:hypothetical protein